MAHHSDGKLDVKSPNFCDKAEPPFRRTDNMYFAIVFLSITTVVAVIIFAIQDCRNCRLKTKGCAVFNKDYVDFL